MLFGGLFYLLTAAAGSCDSALYEVVRDYYLASEMQEHLFGSNFEGYRSKPVFKDLSLNQAQSKAIHLANQVAHPETFVVVLKRASEFSFVEVSSGYDVFFTTKPEGIEYSTEKYTHVAMRVVREIPEKIDTRDIQKAQEQGGFHYQSWVTVHEKASSPEARILFHAPGLIPYQKEEKEILEGLSERVSSDHRHWVWHAAVRYRMASDFYTPSAGPVIRPATKITLRRTPLERSEEE